MSSTKLNNLIEKYNLTNLIKVIVILIILFLLYRIFIEPSKYQIPYNLNKNIYEGFADLTNGSIYGNVISLLEPKNIPVYSGITCTFTLSDTFRIDTLMFMINDNINMLPFTKDTTFSFTFINGNGITKNIKAETFAGTVDNDNKFKATSNMIGLKNIRDENDLPVYTSRIILTNNYISPITTGSSSVDTIVDSGGYHIIKGFGIYGGDKNLLTLTEYKNICSNLISNSNFLTTSNEYINNQNVYNFSQGSNDSLIYSLELSIVINSANNNDIDPKTSTPLKSTTKPFEIQITYQNTLYTQNIFTINTTYKVRSDYNILTADKTTVYIFLTEPIIANMITFTVQNVKLFTVQNVKFTNDASKSLKLKINSITALSKVPSPSEISDYKQTINLIRSAASNADNTNICPSINELINTQTKTQQLSDNIEYQDKIKSEKLRLERNKQYLLKLKDQQEQLDQLNTAIQTLEDLREARATTSDQVRVLQYQKQKADASSVRDMANQRLDSQANNQLYMDVSVNST